MFVKEACICQWETITCKLVLHVYNNTTLLDLQLLNILLNTSICALGWHKNFSELYISHFQVDWMLLLRYGFVIFHINLNLGPDNPNKVTNQSPAAITGPMRASVWLPLGSDWFFWRCPRLVFVLCEKLQTYLNKII